MKIGIIGFGAMGTLHANQVAHIDDVEISVVVEPSVVNRNKAESYFAGQSVEIYDGLEEALSTLSPDGWIITSGTTSHIPIAQQLLKLGHKVLLEKPLAQSYEDARTLKDLVEIDSSNLMLGHILLWNKEFQALKDEVGRRGEISSIICSRERPAGSRMQYPGESPFTLTMVHDLYTVHSLMDGEQPIKFSAQVRNHLQGGVDLAQGQLTWARGGFAGLLSNYLIPDEITNGGNVDQITVSGDGWRVQLVYDSGKIAITTKAGTQEMLVPPPLRTGATNYFDDALRSEQEYFFDVLRGNKAVLAAATYEDACQIQEWISNFISLTQDDGAN